MGDDGWQSQQSKQSKWVISGHDWYDDLFILWSIWRKQKLEKKDWFYKYYSTKIALSAGPCHIILK